MAVINGIAHSSGGFYPLEIQQSLRFDRPSSSSLTRTPSVAGNRKTWTYSTWVKFSSFTANEAKIMLGSGTGAEARTNIYFWHFTEGLHSIHLYQRASGVENARRTTEVFRDTSAWYHVVVKVDTTQPGSLDRVQVFVNGSLQTMTSNSNYSDFNQNQDTYVNANVPQAVGNNTYDYQQGFDGYMAETRLIDGQALDPTAFGQLKNGVWLPKKYNGSYGTNGFYLDYSDGANIGADRSGNGNDYTPTNLASTDIMLDSPTNNFATLNVNDNPGTGLSEGNLKSSDDDNSWGGVKSTIPIPETGKWYFESLCQGFNRAIIGVARQSLNLSNEFVGFNVDSYGYHRQQAITYNNAVSTPYGNVGNIGDITGVLFDADAGTLTFYLNNVSQGAAFTGLLGQFCFAVSNIEGSIDIVNFGQDSSFAGTKTRQGFTDANGIGDFYYQPPAGALALCTANLPEPAFSPLDDSLPSDHFNTLLWTGDGAANRSLTGVGFQPDWVWIKARNQGYSHVVFDSLRGAGKDLSTNYDGSEVINSTVGYLTSFDSDGFSVTNSGTGQHVNGATVSYIAWNWKAGGAPVTNNNGSVTSTVSANVEAGFSIVSYTGTGANDTVGHGLTKTPELVIHKNRSIPADWLITTTVIDGSVDVLYLNTTAASVDSTIVAPTNSVINLLLSDSINGSGYDYIAYCFHSVEGFSKIGTYGGNGILNDGPFVYTGFKPAYLMVKRTDAAGNWHVFDNTRDPYNQVDQMLNPNLSDAETVYPDGIDFLSNGFKHLGTGAGLNADGETYLYMAFAEMPFKYANAR